MPARGNEAPDWRLAATWWGVGDAERVVDHLSDFEHDPLVELSLAWIHLIAGEPGKCRICIERARTERQNTRDLERAWERVEATLLGLEGDGEGALANLSPPPKPVWVEAWMTDVAGLVGASVPTYETARRVEAWEAWATRSEMAEASACAPRLANLLGDVWEYLGEVERAVAAWRRCCDAMRRIEPVWAGSRLWLTKARYRPGAPIGKILSSCERKAVEALRGGRLEEARRWCETALETRSDARIQRLLRLAQGGGVSREGALDGDLRLDGEGVRFPQPINVHLALAVDPLCPLAAHMNRRAAQENAERPRPVR